MTESKKNQKIKGPLIAPSILSANFAQLGNEVQDAEAAGADWLHIDVMDGHFVPNLTFGPWIVETLQPLTQLPLDCHLMVSEPEKWVESFARAGAFGITVHLEASVHLNRLLNQIRDLKCRVGISINPGTPLSALEEVLDLVDLVLVMGVNPGFGGQKLIESSILKIQRLNEIRRSRFENKPFLIQVDGGINPGNIGRLKNTGADIIVVGSAFFSAKDRGSIVKQLRDNLSGAPSESP